MSLAVSRRRLVRKEELAAVGALFAPAIVRLGEVGVERG